MIAALERLEAQILHRRASNGKGGAVFVSAGSETTQADCVLKFSSRLIQAPVPHLLEWVGHAFGRAIGIDVGVSYAVDISSEFAGAIADATIRGEAMASIGLHYASRVEVGMTQPIPGLLLTPTLRERASELLAFDLFIHNFDRRVGNPNVLIGRDRVFAFDHGDAFAYVYPMIGAPDPATDPLLNTIERHVFGLMLRRKLADLSDFRQRVASLGDSEIQAILDATPAEWKSGSLPTAVRKIADVTARRRDALASWLGQVENWMKR
jgi:hypothetical protein